MFKYFDILLIIPLYFLLATALPISWNYNFAPGNAWLWGERTYGSKLNCTIEQVTDKPTSVHNLRPGDIQVVGALGDSITAGNGASANHLPEVLFEYRGQSWSIGGQSDLSTYSTVPNILKEFRKGHEISGFSIGVAPVWWEERSRLNLAHPGDHSGDIIFQAKNLVARMKNSKERIDFENEWKLITIFIGGNDICDSCKNWEQYSPENYVANYNRTLHYLRENVPRLFVNVVNLLDISYMMRIQNYGFVCNAIHYQECPCVTKEYQSEWPKLIDTLKEYQNRLRLLIDTEYSDANDNFTAVLQPAVENIFYDEKNNSGEIDGDLSYLAPDCFHLSQKGHAAASRWLWNSMILPVGQKPNTIKPENFTNTALLCPDKNCPFLATVQNSKDCSTYARLRLAQ